MTSSSRVTLKPGDTIGILGGGQLGRMLALAAARLGLRAQVFSPDPDSPAFEVVQNATCAEYADVEALELFASDVDRTYLRHTVQRQEAAPGRGCGVRHSVYMYLAARLELPACARWQV